MADDPLEQLTHDEKERLAELVKGGTSRRDMLKAGGALGVGALVGGGGYAASTQNAKADADLNDSDGNVGTPSNPSDVFADGVAVFDGANNQIGSLDENGLDIASVSTEQIGVGRHYAGSYDGSDVDVRLDNAISAASAGDIIYLESGTYNSNRTISTQLYLSGLGRGSIINAKWTLATSHIVVENINIDGNNSGEIEMGFFTILRCCDNSGTPVITATGGNCLVTEINGADITLESGTSGTLIDTCTTTTVTDNGTSTVGDVT